jgi:hypothetical protein
MKKIVTSLVILALTFLVLAAVLIATGRAETAAPRTPERKVYHIVAPLATIRGFVLDIKLLGTEDNIFTNVRIRAYGVPQDVSLLFCGYQVDRIDSGPMVLKFEAISPRKYQGIGCFTLISAERWREDTK